MFSRPRTRFHLVICLTVGQILFKDYLNLTVMVPMYMQRILHLVELSFATAAGNLFQLFLEDLAIALSWK